MRTAKSDQTEWMPRLILVFTLQVILLVLPCDGLIYFRNIEGIDNPGRERVLCIPLKSLALLYGGSCSCHLMRMKLQVQYMVDLAEKENSIDFYLQCFKKRSRLRITESRVRIPLEARFFPNLNGASLHRAVHVHPSIVLK